MPRSDPRSVTMHTANGPDGPTLVAEWTWPAAAKVPVAARARAGNQARAIAAMSKTSRE